MQPQTQMFFVVFFFRSLTLIYTCNIFMLYFKLKLWLVLFCHYLLSVQISNTDACKLYVHINAYGNR